MVELQKMVVYTVDKREVEGGSLFDCFLTWGDFMTGSNKGCGLVGYWAKGGFRISNRLGLVVGKFGKTQGLGV